MVNINEFEMGSVFMKATVLNILDELIKRYPELKREKSNILNAYTVMRDSFGQEGKLLVCGNGGSAADSEHIVGELMKGFVKKRPIGEELKEKILMAGGDEALAGSLQGALTAIALTGHSALSTAYSNDVNGIYGFAQQTLGYGKAGDVLLGISTSGNSSNVIEAMKVARAIGMKTVALTGRDGGKMKALADISIIAPEQETYKIQEYHLPIYHALCLMLEETYFDK